MQKNIAKVAKLRYGAGALGDACTVNRVVEILGLAGNAMEGGAVRILEAAQVSAPALGSRTKIRHLRSGI